MINKSIPVALLLSVTTGCLSFEARLPHENQSIVSSEAIAVTDSWTSDWIVPNGPFDQALPSWNIDLPEGAAFRVDIQVAEDEVGASSPWLDLGGWGEWPEELRSPVAFDSGKVSIDILDLSELHARARFRLRTRSAEADDPVVLQRLFCVFTNRGMMKEQVMTALKGPNEAFLIEVPARSQKSESAELAPRICSPTSVAMVLEHYGHDYETAEVAALLYDPENDIYGNWNRAAQGAHMLGVPALVVRIYSWMEAETYLRTVGPLIISIGVEPGQLTGAPYEATSGHLLVLCGLDGNGNAWVMDPAVPAGERQPRKYSMEELLQVWLVRGGFTYALNPLPE